MEPKNTFLISINRVLQRSYPGKLLKALEELRVIKTLPHTPGVPNELYQINHSKALEELRVIKTLFHTPSVPNELYQINHSKALEEPRVYRKFAEYSSRLHRSPLL
jgi:regulator of RNase E activity RraB